jgi:hypothetical protein
VRIDHDISPFVHERFFQQALTHQLSHRPPVQVGRGRRLLKKFGKDPIRRLEVARRGPAAAPWWLLGRQVPALVFEQPLCLDLNVNVKSHDRVSLGGSYQKIIYS